MTDLLLDTSSEVQNREFSAGAHDQYTNQALVCNKGPEEQHSLVTAEQKTATPARHSLQVLMVHLAVKLSERARPQGIE